MLNVVMPMAGRGKRFVDAGYSRPKPLIPIHGFPMTQVVIENLKPKCPHQFIFLILRDHAKSFGFDQHLSGWIPGCQIVYVDRVTEGAACTVLLARHLIDSAEPLMIANCDQWVDVDVNDYLDTLARHNADGLIMTMKAEDPKWSFVGFDPQGRVDRVVEKQAVSNEATVGIYNFRHGADYVAAADAMIASNLRVNNEFYVAPTYNQLIAQGKKIVVHNVGAEDCGMHGLGIPTDLDRFVSNDVSRKAVRSLDNGTGKDAEQGTSNND